jgi:hypothetical protein
MNRFPQWQPDTSSPPTTKQTIELCIEKQVQLRNGPVLPEVTRQSFFGPLFSSITNTFAEFMGGEAHLTI